MAPKNDKAQKNDNGKLTRRQQAELIVRKRIIRTIVTATIAVALFIAIVALVYNASNKTTTTTSAAATATALTTAATTAATTADAAATAGEITKNSDYARDDDPIATITMADGGVITVELYPAAAPNTVANFVELANSGFYDGLTFHRVMSGFMIQGGDPNGDGTGGPGYSIAGEFTENGVDNKLTHTRGVISMARTSTGYDTAGSQFFIMHADATYLDGQYAAFGEVTSGMDVVDQIASVETDANNKPLTDVVIQSIRVDTKGVQYTAEKIED